MIAEPLALRVRLASVVDWEGFAHALCALHGEPGRTVAWVVDDAGAAPDAQFGDLFDSAPDPGDIVQAAALPAGPAVALPRDFVSGAREVFLHADPARLPLLARLFHRLADDRRHWADTLHPDRIAFDQLRREVHRDMHKMKAFVRFRQVPEPDGDVRHVAWFEPAHAVVEVVAPFFARRFAGMRWALLTPRVCVRWDPGQLVDDRASDVERRYPGLSFGPGATRDALPAADAGEALWLAYYRSIFNPSRLKPAMMRKEMPVRYWPNLPEAALVASLVAEADARGAAMVAAGGTARLRPRGAAVRALPRAGDAATPFGHIAGDVDAAQQSLPGSPQRARVIPLVDLRRTALACRDCPGADAATQVVWGEGPADARLMLVGEQPGDLEDLHGRPFVGPAGQLLRQAIAGLGWDPQALYFTNAVKHFHHEPRGKRRLHKTPGQREVDACRHWLEAEIAALQPRAVVALGATALRSLLGRDVGVRAHEGEWFVREDGLRVLACAHPAAILRADPARRAAAHRRWLDVLQRATETLQPPTVDA